MTYKGKKVSVVVPAYNEQDLIEKTLASIPKTVDRIYVVDDCSTDNTSEVAKRHRDKRVKVFSHDRNRGVGAAISTGYLKSIEDKVDYIVVMAGDNQMDPKHLPKLLDPLCEGVADYTKGNRLMTHKARKGMPVFRIIGNSLLSVLTKISSGYWDLVDPQNGYTAVKSEVLAIIHPEEIYEGYGYPNDILIKLNAYRFRVKDVDIISRYGSEKSKIFIPSYILSVSKLLFKGFFWRLKEKYVIQSFHPLVFFYILGILLLPLGVILGAYMVFLRIFEGPITASSVMIPVFLTIIGFQNLFFAMLFDMEMQTKT